ncbi:hypothetical protein E2C01_057929 [Portunus trituberculatus]|uniref:Uncharacterized protein n=1 Tax=Portunus trituberculatus TaxID=210409 RepID=A0A5B7H1A9_PORTR|nr:hypothetical protein [Portunus trituberculatus]
MVKESSGNSRRFQASLAAAVTCSVFPQTALPPLACPPQPALPCQLARAIVMVLQPRLCLEMCAMNRSLVWVWLRARRLQTYGSAPKRAASYRDYL